MSAPLSSDTQRWAAALSTFDEIVDLDAGSLGERLRAIGASDPDLRRALETMLAADAEADSRLARVEAAFGSPGVEGGVMGRDADPLELVGRSVGHFRVIELLAYGGMGVVYRAEDMRLERAIALKFPLPAHRFDRSAKERFLHEARLAGSLDHPNVCGIYEAGETDNGHFFYAMPLYDGETLHARLAREGALPIDVALAVARQIAQGLGAAQRAGIIHRDLKPANVMLLPDGTVKILDFGLAKATDASLTMSRTVLGTASYMAPEQVRGREVDTRTDLWALGVVLYQMLSGRRPFDGENEVAIAYAIVHSEPARLSTWRGEIDAPIEELVCTLLRKDPAKRYASAAHVASALDAIPVGRRDRPRRLARVSPPSRARGRAAGLTATAVLALIVGAWLVRGRIASTPPLRTVAVLPFEQLSDGADGGHLAAGLSDGISNQLLRVRGVAVPGYLSTSAYRSTTRSLQDVAGELEARAVVTGSIRRAGDRVRVDARLFDAAANRTIWSRQYDQPVAELLDIERDVTRAILDVLRVELASAERAMLNKLPTTNARAYDLYLQAREIELQSLQSGTRMPIEAIQQAQSLYARARDLDPAFAIARARLARMLMYGATTYDTTQARREQARLEAETALRLAPGLPEAHAAMAAYWRFGVRDLPKAIEQAELAVQASPNSADLHFALGHVYRDAGRWEEAVAQYERAMRLDPRNARIPTEAAFTYVRLRRDEAAMRAFDRAIALAPDNHMVKVIKGHTYLRWKGTADTLAAVLRNVPADWDPQGMTTWARYTVLRVQRRDREALAMLAASSTGLSRDGLVYQPIALMRAQSYESVGERGQARTHYEAARAVLRDSIAAHPRDASIRVALGLAYAGLGRKTDAVREARRAMDLAPLAQNSLGATAFMGVAVEVFGRVGELDEAFKLLELLLAMPAGREVTIAFLQVWPGFDPLRGDARFQELLARFPVESAP
jgi:serine/threonine-protein kinase